MKRQVNRNGYSLLSSKHSDDEDVSEEIQFPKRKTFDVPTVEIIIEDGETLQALAIRYHIPLAELKRLNNIHKENEIYARRTIKVPARPFAIPRVHVSGNNSPKHGANSENNNINNKVVDKLHQFEVETEVNSVIFNTNLVEIPKDENVLMQDEDEEHVSLIPVANPEIVLTRRNKLLHCSDADISWIGLLICIVLLIVMVPLIYVIYIKEHINEYHHKHS